MSLIKFAEFFNPLNNLEGEFEGEVVFNNDPEKLQRVKVKIIGLLESDDISLLPFVTPKVQINPQGKVISPPEIGQKIVITFPYRNPYLPFYENYFDTEQIALARTHAPVFNVDYPHTVGYEDTTGTYLAINKQQKYIDFKHNSGFRVQINQQGKCEIDVPDNLEIEINKQTDIHGVQVIKIYSDDKIELNKPAILPSARKTDLTKHFCPLLMSTVDGWIDKGNSKVIENI